MLGTITAWKRDDGTVELGDGDPMIAVSLALMAEQADPRFLFVRDGLVVFTGVGPDGQPREVRYRAVGFQASSVPLAELGDASELSFEERAGLVDEAMYEALRATEGGYVLLERVA